MQCPECQTDNPIRETVCIACGATIVRDCPVCGYANPVHVEACGHCDHDLGTWQPSLHPAAAPLINRDSEMAAIETALSRAKQGYGQIVGVLGMPGVGKTRLCRELVGRSRVAGMPAYEVVCPFHGKDVLLLPIRDLLRALCGVRPEHDPETVRDRVATALRVLGPEVESSVPLMHAFLGAIDPENPPPEMEVETRRELIADLVTRLVLARSEAEPVVLLIDDAQWLDPESDGVVARIVDGTSETRLLLLLTFRPGYHASWTGKAYYHQLALRPLLPEASEELLQSLLGDDPSLSGAMQMLVERTRGYPFFIEEAVRWLAMNHLLTGKPCAYRLVRPLETHAMPATIESAVAGRLESTPEMGRRVLYAASIIGGRVATPVLRRVADLSERDLWRVLGELEEAAFVSTDDLSSTAECTFIHPLLQEVTYYSQPPQKRAHLHGVVATALEEEYASNLGEHASLIAHHWEAANDKFKADLWRRRALRGVKPIRVRRPPRKSGKH